MMEIYTILRCPVCGACFLPPEEGMLRCTAGHTFDIAAEGYVNLLPPGKAKNARTGDEKAMLRARRDFLQAGYYDVISDGIAAMLADFLPSPALGTSAGEIVLCDSGAGEGYHTLRFAEQVHTQNGAQVTALGFEASKYGCSLAMKHAKQKKMQGFPTGTAPVQAAFFPGNLFALPLADHSIHGLVSMFAPVADAENHRILKEDGLLVTAASGVRHLEELRHILFSDVVYREKEPVYTHFRCIEKRTVSYTVVLPTAEAIWNLFTMTPFYYKTNEEGRARLRAQKQLSITVQTELRAYRPSDAE